MQSEFGDGDSPDPGGDQTPTLPAPVSSSPQESEPPPTQSSSGSTSSDGPRDNIACLQYVGTSLIYCVVAATNTRLTGPTLSRQKK